MLHDMMIILNGVFLFVSVFFAKKVLDDLSKKKNVANICKAIALFFAYICWLTRNNPNIQNKSSLLLVGSIGLIINGLIFVNYWLWSDEVEEEVDAEKTLRIINELEEKVSRKLDESDKTSKKDKEEILKILAQISKQIETTNKQLEVSNKNRQNDVNANARENREIKDRIKRIETKLRE